MGSDKAENIRALLMMLGRQARQTERMAFLV
jgi:hypothetical protein